MSLMRKILMTSPTGVPVEAESRCVSPLRDAFMHSSLKYYKYSTCVTVLKVANKLLFLMFGLVSQNQTTFCLRLCMHVLLYVKEISLGHVPVQTEMEDKAPPAALCLLEPLVEEVFGSSVLKDCGWEHADVARTAKVSSSQRVVILPLGLSRMIIVRNSCGELTRLELKCVSSRVFNMGNDFPFLCSAQ